MRAADGLLGVRTAGAAGAAVRGSGCGSASSTCDSDRRLWQPHLLVVAGRRHLEEVSAARPWASEHAHLHDHHAVVGAHDRGVDQGGVGSAGGEVAADAGEPGRRGAGQPQAPRSCWRSGAPAAARGLDLGRGSAHRGSGAAGGAARGPRAGGGRAGGGRQRAIAAHVMKSMSARTASGTQEGILVISSCLSSSIAAAAVSAAQMPAVVSSQVVAAWRDGQRVVSCECLWRRTRLAASCGSRPAAGGPSFGAPSSSAGADPSAVRLHPHMPGPATVR